jgi:threonine aldolase
VSRTKRPRLAQPTGRYASNFFRSVFVFRSDDAIVTLIARATASEPRSRKWSAKLSYLENMPEMNPRHKRAPCDFLGRLKAGLRTIANPSLYGAIWQLDQGESTMNFASDNGAGVAPEILEAIAASSLVNTPAYGADDYTARAEAMLSEIFETRVVAFLVATGTAANALALSALAQPWSAVFCHEEAHIHDDECGAPEFFTGGAKLVGIAGWGGKITPADLRETLGRFPSGLIKSVQPGALSLSQATEAGTVYWQGEVGALCDIAHSAGVGVHMDGARFANAMVASQLSPAEMTWRAGVDALSFGATKNGALACEAVVFFDPARAMELAYRRKRAGHTLSKGRFLGAQMEAYLKDGLWLRLAERANEAAHRLSKGLAAAPGLRLAWPTEANEVFVVAPKVAVEAWRAAGAQFHEWSTRSLAPEQMPGDGERLLRLVTSFETEQSEVDQLLGLYDGAYAGAAQ